MPRISAAPRTAGSTGTSPSRTSIATPDARASSFSTDAAPPRVASRMQRSPGPAASSMASTIGHSGRVSDRSSASSSNSPRASMIAIPCVPTGPETSTRSPGRSAVGDSRARGSTRPMPVVVTYIRSAWPRSTTFVSPATTETPAASAALAIASTSNPSSSAVSPSSRIRASVSASGRAPATARSLTVPFTLALILEEGLAAEELGAEVDAIARAAEAAGVSVVAGDTKVVERGHADKMYVTTTGVGRVDPRARLSPTALRPGDRVIVSGPVGTHGMAIMLARGEFELDADLRSDTRPLWPMVDAMLEAAGPGLRCLRDATRGGAASVLNELARASGVAMLVREGDVPVEPAVRGAAEILGIDPMYVANEGVLVAVVAPDAADAALDAMRAAPGGARAREIGEVRTEPPGMVLVQTAFGGRRVMDQLVGDPLPRIC